MGKQDTYPYFNTENSENGIKSHSRSLGMMLLDKSLVHRSNYTILHHFQDTAPRSVYMTACDLEQYFNLVKKVNITVNL